MPRKRKTWFAILGLLSWQPMSGYDIKKLIEMGLSHFWSESYGQLFPTLNRLVDEGLARRKEERRHGKRTRHVYTITPRGREALEAWLHETSDLPRVRNEFLLKFFLTSHRPLAESIRLLEDYRVQQRERLEHYLESEKILAQAVRDRTLPPEVQEVLSHGGPGSRDNDDNKSNQELVFLLTLRHGILALESRMTWCQEALETLRAACGKDDPRALE